ncbi:MAG: DUF2726 domain-containing protein [Burkholderiales bacterium]
MNIWLIALLVVLAALVLLWWLRREPGAVRVAEPEDRIDTLIGWPPQATRVMTTPERIAFGTLVRALPEYMVLAQVPLSRFLSVPKRNSYSDWLRRLGYQSVDFVVCDMTSQVIAVIEIQGADSRNSERARKRLSRIGRSLKAASIPMHVWTENVLPSIDAAREAVLPRPTATATDAAPVQSPLSGPASMALANNANDLFMDTDREATSDDVIEAPPSTWFDEFDSGPTPLQKR